MLTKTDVWFLLAAALIAGAGFGYPISGWFPESNTPHLVVWGLVIILAAVSALSAGQFVRLLSKGPSLGGMGGAATVVLAWPWFCFLFAQLGRMIAGESGWLMGLVLFPAGIGFGFVPLLVLVGAALGLGACRIKDCSTAEKPDLALFCANSR